MSTKGLPFEITRRLISGGWAEHARFSCARCGGHADLRLIRGGSSFNPEATVKLAVDAGWRASQHSVRAECPRCVKQRRAAAAGESPGKKPPVAQPISNEATMSAPVTPLSNAQRLRVRALLDKHFDDGAGRYLDGYSDQRIATEVDVPRVHVEGIRDLAYGPIRVPPEMEAAEKAVAALESKLPDAKRLCDQVEQLMRAARESVDAARKALAA